MDARTPLTGALCAALLLAMGAGHAASAANAKAFADPYPHPDAVIHTVIQIDRKDPLTEKLVLHNTANLLKYYGDKRIQAEVVAYGPGIDLLMKNNANAAEIKRLTDKGVMFAACENTMHALHITRSELNADAHPVPSGAVAVLKRQQQGWEYLRP
ncbi:MAG TPA: DsrE family protein [Gammaproteobacteria bacterium]|nr:DsrE family protein [Gammaproteobacteria bacterium]